jgi:hypothetical protein
MTRNFTEAEVLACEDYLRVYIDWFYGRLQRIEGGKTKAARRAQSELQSLLLNSITELLRIALDEKDSAAKQWAGELLANIGAHIEIEEEKLTKVNARYRDWRSNIGKKLQTVLYPKAAISVVVQCELDVVESHRTLLQLLGPGDGWQQEAKRLRIRECYWPARKLPEFEVRTEPQWWELSWPMIKKNYPGLLTRLRNESHSNAALQNKARWSTFRRQFRQHLQLLARHRARGVR